MKNNFLQHKTLVTISMFFCALFFIVLYSFYPLFVYDINSTQHVTHKLAESKAPGQILMYDRNDVLITDIQHENGYYRHIKTDLNSEFVKALLLIEDKNYYSHYGINLLSKFRAIKDNITGNKISGASTITEQYVKNKYFKNNRRTILQKLREAVLAIYITGSRDKDNILNIYYHDAYFGNQLYGVGAALEVYFKKDRLEDLTAEEITILLSLLNNPGIDTLEEEYFQQYFNKVKERLGYSFERTYFGKLNKKENINMLPFVTNHYINTGGYYHDVQGFKTTIDSELQQYTKEVISEQLLKLGGKNVTNAAVFAIIPGNSKKKKPQEILIYQGSREFDSILIDGQVDVIQSKRQPGSTVKPFLYLMALESGMSPDDLIIDIESEYNSFQKGKSYVTENYSLKEYGLVRVKKALGNSMNNATVRLANELGLEKTFDFYRDYGFSFDFDAQHYGYSLVLGNAETTLQNLVESYAKLLPLDSYNNDVSRDKYLLQDILSDPDNRDISFGVNSVLNTSISQAVKTGTSSDFRDNWVISYHPDLVVGVWVGNNDNSSMIGITGITGAGNIWHKIIEKSIELGYVTGYQENLPLSIIEGKYCLDKNCFQMELIYKKIGKEYFSRIGDGVYSKRDIAEKLSNFEKNKLDKMGIQIFN